MLTEVMTIFDTLDKSDTNGYEILELFKGYEHCKTEFKRISGAKGSTDFIRIRICGTSGEAVGGSAPTLGITGRLGGLGARPQLIGFVSDGDGALSALSAALKLAKMSVRGDRLPGDVVISTHICPNAPVVPHDPVPLMDSPMATIEVNRLETEVNVDAILSLDTTKGNRIFNHRGIAITSTVKQGYILRVSEDLMNIYQRVCGILPLVLPISTQDITPYGNGIYHLNSIMQPAVASNAPVVGVAITSQSAVAGCATGATQLADCELAARFAVETAKDFTGGKCSFYNASEFDMLVELYGGLEQFQAK